MIIGKIFFSCKFFIILYIEESDELCGLQINGTIMKLWIPQMVKSSNAGDNISWFVLIRR